VSEQYTSQARPVAAPPLTSGQAAVQATQPDRDQIIQQIIQRSIRTYSGNCPCPYNTTASGRRCGGNSAYSRPGGRSPICYPSDVSEAISAIVNAATRECQSASAQLGKSVGHAWMSIAAGCFAVRPRVRRVRWGARFNLCKTLGHAWIESVLSDRAMRRSRQLDGKGPADRPLMEGSRAAARMRRLQHPRH
jgi:hypothetical protein